MVSSLLQHQFLTLNAVTSGCGGGTKRKLGVWRLSRLEVPVDKDPGKDWYHLSEPLIHVLALRLGCKPCQLSQDAFTVVRKSFDARKEPRFIYTVDMDVAKMLAEQPRSWSSVSRMKQHPGVIEFLAHARTSVDLVAKVRKDVKRPASCVAPVVKVIVVGSGPAGLFAALALAEIGVRVTIVERGYPVEKRGRHIGSLMARRILRNNSNFCYGEGGAGTWSDGKLTTRIGKNSDDVQTVLRTLVRFGAPDSILIDGKPHIGTDRLVKILQALRLHLQELGVEFMFGCTMEDLLINNGRATGIQVTQAETLTTTKLECDGLVLGVGHSARDTYEMLLSHGVTLAPKEFAVGLRVEHPQELINQLRYRAWALGVDKGRGKVPVADYKLTAAVRMEEEIRSCYSFCMCPGGQIVPTSTDLHHLCINGMSFSKRSSNWANAALVVNVAMQDIEPFVDQGGPLAGVAFQRALEREAAIQGGGDFVAPVQCLPDFLEDKVSRTIPSSSYRLGVRASPLHELLPLKLTKVLKDAAVKFNHQLHGFIDSRALLHGVETRTSSPVTIVRDERTYESVSVKGLYPVGEGAGYAGGIVSAAVDGMKAGFAIGTLKV